MFSCRLLQNLGGPLEVKEAFFLSAFLLGHVGDGNFHALFTFDPNDPNEVTLVKRLAEEIAL